HDAGSIRFRGEEVGGLPPHQLCRRGMGRTFQITSIFRRLTVMENVQTAFLTHHGRQHNLVRRATSLYRGEALALLERVGLAEPAGKATRAPPARGARAPALLLLDEPTAGMAPREPHDIMALVARIAAETGLTVVFTEHD